MAFGWSPAGFLGDELPSDKYPNDKLLAQALDLTVSSGFARHQTIHCGVQGESDLDTTALIQRTAAWASTAAPPRRSRAPRCWPSTRAWWPTPRAGR